MPTKRELATVKEVVNSQVSAMSCMSPRRLSATASRAFVGDYNRVRRQAVGMLDREATQYLWPPDCQGEDVYPLYCEIRVYLERLGTLLAFAEPDPPSIFG